MSMIPTQVVDILDYVDDSELTFGYYDMARYEGVMNWHKVRKDQPYWGIELDDILLDGIPLNLCQPSDRCLITPDSGTSKMTMPTNLLALFEKKIGYIPNLPCEDAFGLGTISYVIDGIHYKLPSHHWNQRVVNSKTGTGTCSHSFLGLDVGAKNAENLFVAGDLFMQIYYSVFNRDTDMIGLALARHKH